MPRPHPLLTAADIAALPASTFVHPLNPKAIRHGKALGDAIAFEYLGIHLVRVEPGHDSTQYHVHQAEEEFIYILSGRGVAEIGDETFEVGPGDFMGFVTGGLAHSLSNPFKEDLVYLVGGLRLEFDICDYPRINTRLYRRGNQREYVGLGA